MSLQKYHFSTEKNIGDVSCEAAKRQAEARFSEILACLPRQLQQQITRMRAGQDDLPARLSEIRLRAGHQAALTLDGGNMLLPLTLTEEDVVHTLTALCGGSLYAHANTLRMGYLSAYGCRIGVAGRAVHDERGVSGLAGFSSLCIRLPPVVPGAGRNAEEAFRLLSCRAGLLIYSPPGGGKTTLLREFARAISAGPNARRTAIIDTRTELYDEAFPAACQVDVLRGYPLAVGIEMATRTLSPQVIVCDEIGSTQEAETLLSVKGCGVPIVASVHASGVEELLARPAVAMLVAGGVFAAHIGIFRHAHSFFYRVQAIGRGELCCSG